MALSLEAIKATARPATPRCTVGVLLDTLDDGDAEVLTEAMKDKSITGVGIADYLTDNGYQINASPINRHRNGRCTCGA